MPEGYDIFSLGLNIDGFNQQKLQTLREFVALFDQLVRYDGKIINPVLGDGLTKFNTSLRDTNSLLDEMNTRLKAIGEKRLVVKAEAPGIRKMKEDTDDASNSINKFNVNAGGTRTNLEGLGNSLTKLLTNLRYLAYILPGLGIAGIFNLAFKAVEDLTSQFIDWELLFESGTDRMIRKNEEFYKSITSLSDKLEQLGSIIEDVYKTSQTGLTAELGEDKVKKQQDYVNSLKAQGIEQGTLLANEVELARLAKERAEKGLFGGRNVEFTTEISKQVDKLTEVAFEIQRVDKALSDHQVLKNTRIGESLETFFGGFSKEKTEKYRKSLEAEYDSINKALKINQSDLKNYNEAVGQYNEKSLELQKFQSDQARKLLVETTKDNISVSQEAQKTILANDKKFYDEKLKAIEQEYRNEVKLAEASRIAVTGTKENPNVTATPAEIEIAINKEQDEIKKARIKRDKEEESLAVQFYQRKLLATTEAQKDELEKDAIFNEKIFQNEQKGLDERLEAYNKYIEDKKKIRDLEYNLSIQQGASKPGGPTSLTPEEQTRIETHARIEKANVVADAEKKAYEIVYSFLHKQIKETEDSLKEEEDTTKVAYTNALHNLNEQLEKKQISINRYYRERKKLEYQFQKDQLDKQIQDDEEAVKKLEDTYATKIHLELNYRRELLDIAKAGGNKEEIDKAQGAFDAAQKAETEIKIDIANAISKLNSDKLKREQLEPPKIDDWKKWIDEMLRAEHAVNQIIQQIYDARIEQEIQMVEKRKELIDEQYGYEIDAIEKSTLSLKDKQALEIQAQAQQQVIDENAALREKRLKIEEFNFNKKLAIADSAIGIAAAIIRDGLTTPKSIADAIIGAAELGKIIASQPPSFAEGVIGFKGGMARYGEDGAELVKVPGKSAFIALKETISYLPKGTDIIPLNEDSPVFDNKPVDQSWEQTRYLAKEIKKSNKEVKNIFNPTIIVDLNFESRKRQILGN